MIDVAVLLRDALGAFGFSLDEHVDGFYRLKHPKLPKGVAAFFAARAVPLYGIVPLANAQLTLVIHVCDDITDDDYNVFANPLGVHVHRLRALGSLDIPKLDELRSTVVALRAAGVEQTEPPSDEAAPAGLDLAKVATYASTNEDALFEWATAAILAPLVEHTFRFGNAFRGSPVPDGLIVQSREAVLYDCKSKKGNAYDLPPHDGDQINRYLPILDRLAKAAYPIKGRAVLFFTPAIDRAKFTDKVQKEIWASIVARGFQLIFMPATCLARLHALSDGEDSLSAFFDKGAFWSALVDRNLVGISRDDELTRLLGDRGTQRRLLDEADAEIAWLSAIVRRPAVVASVAAAIADVDVEAGIAERVARPAIIRSYFAALRKPSPTIASIAKATGLHERSVEYLVLCSELKNFTLDEVGDDGAKNIRVLTESLRPTK